MHTTTTTLRKTLSSVFLFLFSFKWYQGFFFLHVCACTHVCVCVFILQIPPFLFSRCRCTSQTAYWEASKPSVADLKFWITLECVEALVFSQKHSFELSYQCYIKKSHTFNVGSWINLREGNCTLNFYCCKTQHFWCSLIIWGLLAGLKLLKPWNHKETMPVLNLLQNFHCWIVTREAL